MIATQANLLLLMSGPKQFVIPIYQRTYSWYQSQCAKLLSDILRISNDPNVHAHFIGSIVYFQENIQNISGIPHLLVIDGQQRLTTVTLLIAALSQFLQENKNITIDTTHTKLQNYYLLNNEEEGDLRFKLLLTRRDKETIKNIIKGIPTTSQPSQRVAENFKFFKDSINAENAANIYLGIQRLFVVDVALERDKDNPQLIFESLNSTGLRLSQADLIRNFILMGQPVDIQTNLYERFWHPMETSYGSEYTTLFDKFMRDYLSVKTGVIPNIDQVYDSFKMFVQSDKSPASIESVVEDIYNYSGYYANMVFHDLKEQKLKKVFQNISKLQVAVSYPFLLPIYADYSSGLITEDEFVKIVSLTENYVFRRAICGIPTNSLNKTFLTLYRNVKPDNYLKSIEASFQTLDSYKRFPADLEFSNAFKMKDVYNFRTRNYMLSKLENYNRKENVTIDEYTIEHILPQNPNLSEQWRSALGDEWKEIQEKYLHTIGNLTLTGYNSELSDKPFQFKKTIEGGFDHSPIRMNDFLRTVDFWNEEQINNRAEILAEKAVEVWHAPSLNAEQLSEFYKREDTITSTTTIDSYEYLKGEVFSIFQGLSKRISNLDSSVREEYKKNYIAFKSSTNFVDIVPQKTRLRLSLNMNFDEIKDPKGICKDVTDLGRWGNGNVEFPLSNASEINYAMELIQQAFDKQMEEA